MKVVDPPYQLIQQNPSALLVDASGVIFHAVFVTHPKMPLLKNNNKKTFTNDR